LNDIQLGWQRRRFSLSTMIITSILHPGEAMRESVFVLKSLLTGIALQALLNPMINDV
jgi:hypothetical protein